MHEEADRQIRPQGAKHFRYQLQLVVLHPHGRALGGCPRRRFGEAPVDVDVAIPPLALIDRLDDQVVIERPQGGVGEALVVFLDVLGAEPDREELQAVLDYRILIAVDNAGPSDPCPAISSQQRFQRGHQATGTAFPDDGSVRLPFHVDRQPIGHHHEVGGSGPYGSGVSGCH